MAWCFSVIVLSLLVHVITVGAQLNLYAAKHDVNSYLKLNFNFDLYIIENGEPVKLLEDSRAFYSFMSPLQASVKGVKLSWFSSPQSTYYSLKLSSSDHDMMEDPIASIDSKGVVPHSVVAFYIPLECTGKKGGTVDVAMQLNYTKIVGTAVNRSTQKTFKIQVKKWCEKTLKDPDKDSDSGINHWSRGAIVGLSAGITVFLCVSVGLGLLFKHYMRQRKLKMAFEDDLDLEDKREFDQKKVTSLPIHKPSTSSTSKSPPVLYSPKRSKLRVARPRQRSETNASDTSTLELIAKEESDDELGGVTCRLSKEEVSNSLRETSWRDSLSDILLEPEQLEIKEYTGKGCFGDIYHGILKKQNDFGEEEVMDVSVELIKDGLDTCVSQALLKSLLRAKQYNHPNVLQPIGIVLNTSLQIVLPYKKYVSLDEFLRQHCGMITNKQILDIALKIAEALDYLQSQNHVYKSLSPTECMITEDLDVKLSLYCKNWDKRWMAPECLTGKLSSQQCDVWSFGVILWQLTSQGELPYQEINIDDLINHLESGNRLQQSLNCSHELYSVMLKCWSIDPITRPSFKWLADWLQSYLLSPDTNNTTVC